MGAASSLRALDLIEGSEVWRRAGQCNEELVSLKFARVARDVQLHNMITILNESSDEYDACALMLRTYTF